MFGIKQRIQEGRYLNAKIILAIDLIISLVASGCSCMALNLAYSGGLFNFTRLSAFWLGGAFLFSYILFSWLRTYRAIVRHSTSQILGKLALMGLIKSWMMLAMLIIYPTTDLPLWKVISIAFLDFVTTTTYLIMSRVFVIVVYDYVRAQLKPSDRKTKVLVYGTTEKSLALAMRFATSSHYSIRGLLAPGKIQKNISMGDYKVYFFQNQADLTRLYEEYNIGAVLFATEKELQEERENLVEFIAKNKNLKALIAPPLEDVEAQKGKKQTIREVKIEDLLGRPEIKINMDEIIANFQGKVVMVTGAAGSIGSELCRQLATFGVKQLILFDNAETPMHNLRLEFEDRFPELKFVPVIGDVRQKQRLDFAFRHYRPQVVFHAAAYKHVPLMEENPCEAVLVNVVGSRQVADKCLEYDVEKMVMISTDKAVNPTNIMGCTKRLAEIYVQSLGLGLAQGEVKGKTRFVTTRFGNVLGSNGSVIPRFREQIEKGGPVTVTHPDITRFFMTIPEACRLVMEAATMTDGNQIFVFDMGESVKIADLAKRMIDLAGLKLGEDVEIEYTGLRPGEKLYEEVLSNTENTIPTNHHRIRIAKVREYNYGEACKAVDQLEDFSRAVTIPEMVKFMKEIVPEFKSKNSVFEKFDKEIEEGK